MEVPLLPGNICSNKNMTKIKMYAILITFECSLVFVRERERERERERGHHGCIRLLVPEPPLKPIGPGPTHGCSSTYNKTL
jgi:hypothetical protein